MPTRSWAILAIAQFFALSCVVVAAEPTEDFVKGLQERGLHELALEYLDGLKSSPLADEATRKRIPYLRGVALIEQSRQASEPATRNRLLDEAQKELEEFAKANPQSISAAESQVQLGTVQMGRGQELVAAAMRLPTESAYDAQRKTLNRDARTRFAEARETFQSADATFNKELVKLPPTLSNEARDDTGTQRQLYRGRVAQLRYLAAQTQFELARTYPPNADEYQKLNKSAADELAAVYEEFGRSANTFVGLYAHLAEGRCYQAIGEYAMALGCFEDILRQPNVLEPFRKLIATALHRKAEVLIAQEKYDNAIDACNACLKDARSDEEKQSEWLTVRYRLAEALSKKAQTVAADSPQQKKLLAEARDAYRYVAKFPGELQATARTAAAEAGGMGTGGAGNREEPRTFQAAYDLGKEALASYNAAKLAIPSAEKNNPPAVPELEAQMNRGKTDARRYFQLASTLVEVDTDPVLLNEVRYFLCWLHWEAEDFYRAAVLGEFLARRFPDHPAASSAAKISMAAFERLYNQALAAGNKNDDGDFEARHMAQMADLIVRRWPGTDDADAAFGVLVSIAIRNGKTSDAEKLLGQASTQSRPRLELLLGNALWGRYLELSNSRPASPPDAGSLAKLKTSAIKYLQNGYEAASKESNVSDSGATAALYLVQALLSDGNYPEAIRRLEDKKAGPLTLVAKAHPTASKPQYAIEAYKAALRAYVSMTPPQEAKAVAAMKSLEQIVNASTARDQAAEQLMRIYISMGVSLQKQLEELQASGKQEEATRVAGAFAKFLDRIGAQQAGADWPTRVWLAQMYYSLGTGDPGTVQQSDSPAAQIVPSDKNAREYVAKSRDAYQQLLDEVAKDPKLAPSDSSVLAVKMQLGECYRALGQYEKALDAFSDILRDKEASLAVQRAAAITYQQRGQWEDAQWLERAIHGGYRLKATGQNRIWGWLRISQVAGRAAQSDPRFWDSFYEARLNLSKCRYLAATKLTGDERQQNLAKAKQSIQSLAQLYPKLGGERWKPEFDQLTKDIQREEARLSKAGG